MLKQNCHLDRRSHGACGPSKVMKKIFVGRTPWSAADALVGLFDERIEGDPRGPGGVRPTGVFDGANTARTRAQCHLLFRGLFANI